MVVLRRIGKLLNPNYALWRIAFAAREVAFSHFAMPPKRQEHISKAAIGRYLPPEPVIVDCGASWGNDTVEMATRWKRSRVFAFEPVPELFDKLCANARQHPNITCVNIAIADQPGTRDMHVSSGESDGASSLLAPKTVLRDHPNVTFDGKVSVSATTFSAWAKENGIEQIDLFWLDMQGFEFQALQASEDLVRRSRAIHAEVNLRETYAGAVLYPELRDWLAPIGFEVAIEAIPDGWDAGNVLFVRR